MALELKYASDTTVLLTDLVALLRGSKTDPQRPLPTDP